MSILEPGETPIEEVFEEEPVAVAPIAPQSPINAIKSICKNCRRPGIELDKGWVHLDARVDHPSNPAWCFFELYVEAPVRWGFLNDGKKSQFEVSQGPSKVRDGWSGGGVK